MDWGGGAKYHAASVEQGNYSANKNYIQYEVQLKLETNGERDMGIMEVHETANINMGRSLRVQLLLSLHNLSQTQRETDMGYVGTIFVVGETSTVEWAYTGRDKLSER